jgi:hypothetical protein
MKRKIYRSEVDYKYHPDTRKKLGHYLKTGSFRQIAGTFLPNRRVRRNRIILAAIAVTLTVIGLYHVFI